MWSRSSMRSRIVRKSPAAASLPLTMTSTLRANRSTSDRTWEETTTVFPSWGPVLVTTIVVLFVMVYPVAYVFYGSFKPAGGMLGETSGFTLANYRRIFT